MRTSPFPCIPTFHSYVAVLLEFSDTISFVGVVLLVLLFCIIFLADSSATRIYLRKGRAEERVAKLQDSPDRPEKEASYQITEGGIMDLGG